VSLLNRGAETVTVFPEVVTVDSDGNTMTRPSSVGVVCRAVVQPINTSSANSESQDIGFDTTSKYRLRLVGWHGGLLGAQSAVEWQGLRYAIDGEPLIYNGSSRTARVEYVMVRR
jgi:hypothetical protein